MDHINFIYLWDHLAILLRFYLTDAVFLAVMTALWKLVSPTMKQAGHIQALYRLLLLTEAAAFLLLGAGLGTALFPAQLLGITELYRGHYFLTGYLYLLSTAVLFAVWVYRFRKEFRIFRQICRKENSVRQMCYPCADPEKLAQYREMGALLGLRKLPDLFENPGYTSAFTIGVFHPVVVVPFDVFSAEEQRLAIAHELVHYKRRDVLVRYMDLFLQDLFWFLPAGEDRHREIIILQETLCDGYVCSHLPGESFVEDYYIHIVNMRSRKMAIGRKHSMSAGLVENIAPLRERAQNSVYIRYGQKRYGLVALLCILLLGGIFCLSYVEILPPDLFCFRALSRQVTTTVGFDEETVQNHESGHADADPETEAAICSAVMDGKLTDLLDPNELLNTELNAQEGISTEWLDSEVPQKLLLSVVGDYEGIEVMMVSEDGDVIYPEEEDSESYCFEVKENSGQYKVVIENLSEEEQSMELFLHVEDL